MQARKGASNMGSVFKNVFVLGVGAMAVLYLVNPTAGIIELIPDNLPLIGNLDEAGATLLLMNVLAYFGADLTKIFNRTPGQTIEKRKR
jgi:uncharacterized membrane protein YkvA (DUF1232 family)